MGILSTVLEFCGFGIGTLIGLVVGYYMFIYFQPTDVKVSSIISFRYSLASSSEYVDMLGECSVWFCRFVKERVLISRN